MFMLDLCSGLGGASSAFRDMGWRVLTLDNNPVFKCDITVDINQWNYPSDLPVPDLVWASPPCTEFARESMPWSKTGIDPDLSILKSCVRIIKQSKAKYYIIENVRGAIKYFVPLIGNYRYHVGAFYFWGCFPLPPVIKKTWQNKQNYSSKDEFKRSLVPYSLSSALAYQIQNQKNFFFLIDKK